MRGAPRVHRLSSAGEVMERAAAALIEAASRRPGRVSVALSGGSTPAELYRLLAGAYRDRIPWERLEVFFGDERSVPPDHADSNYRLARDLLLSRVPVPPGQVHRLRGEEPDREAAARDYEEEVRRIVPPGPSGRPAFDLVWLGLGEDGHTASLFPGSAALLERERLVVPAEGPAPHRERLTFTLPLLDAARRVQLLVTGRKKAEAVKRSLAPEGEAAHRAPPAARVRPEAGVVEWLLDPEAGALLPGGAPAAPGRPPE